VPGRGRGNISRWSIEHPYIVIARTPYERALALTQQEPEQWFLDRRLAELPD